MKHDEVKFNILSLLTNLTEMIQPLDLSNQTNLVHVWMVTVIIISQILNISEMEQVHQWL